MRGLEGQQVELFASVQLKERIPKEHPLGGIKALVDHVLKELDSVSVSSPDFRYHPQRAVSKWWRSWITICSFAGLSD